MLDRFYLFLWGLLGDSCFVNGFVMIQAVMLVFDLKRRWEFAGSYRHLLAGIRLQIACRISIRDTNYQCRSHDDESRFCYIGIADVNRQCRRHGATMRAVSVE